ncbi:MAG: sulfotransferase [Woeseiaceae bacterium]|jgi:tetratricopeptide (TPR) repeat protein
MNDTNGSLTTLDVALELHESGNFDAAADIYTRLLEQDPANLDARYGLGTARLQQGNPHSASDLLEQVVHSAPGVPEYHYNYGLVLQQLEQHYAAIEQFNAATIVRPEGRFLWLGLARSLAAVHNYAGAVTAQERVIDSDSATAADWTTAADYYFMAGRYDDARRAVDKARELGRNDPRNEYVEACCAAIAGDDDTERELLRKAVDLRPGFAEAWDRLLDLVPQEEVLALADTCEGLSGDAATPARDKLILRYTLGRAYERLEDYDRAWRHFENANQRQQDEAAANGNAYDRVGNDRFLSWAKTEYDEQGTAASASDDRPIFIVGMPRSGTSLAERIVSNLDGVTMGGESEALEHVSGLYYSALARGESAPLRELQSGHWDELAAGYWHTRAGARGVLTDNTPANFRHVGMLCRMFPSASVIYMRRDPRDAATSLYTHMLPDRDAYATDLGDLAHYCGFSLRLMAHFANVFPDRIIEVDYESLVTDTESESRRIAEFCGLEWQADCLDAGHRQPADVTFRGRQMRQRLATNDIGHWRNYREHLAMFVEACAVNEVPLRDD